MANRTISELWRWSGEGELPVVIDASSCAHGLAGEPPGLNEENRERHGKLEILDSVSWAKRLLPNLEISERLGSVAVHPTCSTRQMGLERDLREIAEAMAGRVVQPIRATCCGMAGDSGDAPSGAQRLGDGRRGRRARRQPPDAYLCSNGPVRSDCRRRPARLSVLRDPARADQPPLDSPTRARERPILALASAGEGGAASRSPPRSQSRCCARSAASRRASRPRRWQPGRPR